MKEWIEEQLADNRSISEIAREMGKSTRTIYQLCKDLKIKLPPRRRGPGSHQKRWTTEELMKIRKLNDDGLSLSEIGDIYGVSRQRIHQVIGGSTR